MKRALLQVHHSVLLDICKHGTDGINVVKNKLPEDAQFITAGHDNLGTLLLVLESNEFEDIEDGKTLPILSTPLFEKKQ